MKKTIFQGDKLPESNDAAFSGEAVIAERYNSPNKSFIYEHKELSVLMDSIQNIDFWLSYYKGTKNEGYIVKLRNDLKGDDRKEAERILKILEPNTSTKVSIVVEDLLSRACKIGCNLGIINNVPHFFNGRYWEVLPASICRNLLSIAAEKSGLLAYQASKAQVVRMLTDQFWAIGVLPEIEPPVDVVKIPLQNGTFVYKDKKVSLEKFSAYDRFTYQLDYNYDPTATAPRFMQFLEEVIPEDNARLVVSEYAGYVFAKALNFEKCLVFVGEGCNGKSVLMNIITAIFGANNVSSYSLRDLTHPNGYCRAEIANKLLNACAEMGVKDSDPNTAKLLISNEPVEARSPYKPPFILRNYCRFIFNTNTYSFKDVEHSKGYFRRFMFLRFDTIIPLERRDPNLASYIINNEMSGVFNWALSGLFRLLEKGCKDFTHSDHIEQEMIRFQKDSNSVAGFLDDMGYVKSPHNYVVSTTLFSEYKEYCCECNYKAVGLKEFINRVEKSAGILVKRKCTNNATHIFCEKTPLAKGETIPELDGVTSIIDLINSNKDEQQEE